MSVYIVFGGKMKYAVKTFGKNGLHLTLKKSEGFKVGDVVNIGSKPILDEDLSILISSEVNDIVDVKLKKLKESMKSDFFEAEQLLQLFEIFKKWRVSFDFAKAKEDIDIARKKEGF